LSKLAYNAKRGLVIACPITSQIKGYPLEVPIDVKKRASVVLPDHVRSVDSRARKVSPFASKCGTLYLPGSRKGSASAEIRFGGIRGPELSAGKERDTGRCSGEPERSTARRSRV